MRQMALTFTESKLRRLLSRRRAILALSGLLSLFLLLALFSSVFETRKPRRRLLANAIQPQRSAVVQKATPRETDERPMRTVHLDLKGAPPSIDYLLQLFPLLSSLGADAILLEYEDMFPFVDQLEVVKAHNAFTEANVKTIVSAAEKSGLHVIPLIQTFGHLEFVLKLEPFAGLREVAGLPQAICPLRNGTWSLLRQMVDQVARLHPNSRFLHIGCDEVFQIGFCDLCSKARDRDRLFLDHVYKVAEHVVRAHQKTPIIWDDMLRQMSIESIRESRLGSLGVEPMVWTYVSDIYRFIPQSQFVTYAQLFPRVWAASAYKGAFGETLTVPDIRMHVENNLNWVRVMRELKVEGNVRFRGIALTGWSRYDHLATLCELIPAALPSLALNLILVTRDARFEPKEVFREFERKMDCPPQDDYYGREEREALDQIQTRDPNMFIRAQDCRFVGSHVFQLMRRHAEVTHAVDQYLYDVTEHKAWLTDFNVRHNITSPYRVDEGLQEFHSVNYSLNALMRQAKDALSRVYDKDTTAEWIEQKIYPYVLKMDKLFERAQALKQARVWPKRPLPMLADLKRRLDSL